MAIRSSDSARCCRYRIWQFAGMAAKNTSVAWGDHFTAFAAQQVASGRYSSMSEVIPEGDESGDSESFDMRAWIAER